MTEVNNGQTKVYTTTVEHTSNMWVTLTSNGVTTVVQTTFAQRFTSQYDHIASAKTGSIGLGTIKGSVGVIKSDLEYTLSSTGGAPQASIVDRSFFLSLVAFLMWFL
ncbi:uncharacterized protein ZBAI_01277 [Zygosaccharomyces bailii ISA1307]|nr:uncharacterized protein ZBAI_01277 [Zygosaccharomyces bailii ISA1307]